MNATRNSSSTFEEWMWKLDDVDSLVASGQRSDGDMVKAIKEIVSEMKQEIYCLQLNIYVENENPLLFQLLVIVAKYLNSPNDIFQSLNDKKLLKSADFFICWSRSLRTCGKTTEAIQVVAQGIVANPSQVSVLRKHLDVLNTVENKELSDENAPTFNELANEIVKTIIHSLNLWSCDGYTSVVQCPIDTEVSPAKILDEKPREEESFELIKEIDNTLMSSTASTSNENNSSVEYEQQTSLSTENGSSFTNRDELSDIEMDQPINTNNSTINHNLRKRKGSLADANKKILVEETATDDLNGEQDNYQSYADDQLEEDHSSTDSRKHPISLQNETKVRKGRCRQTVSKNKACEPTSEPFILKYRAPGNESQLTEKQLAIVRHFNVYLPQRKGESKENNYSLSVRCPGCLTDFKARANGIYEQNFYKHCVKECEPYEKLGLISHCMECKHSFYNNRSYRLHPCCKGDKSVTRRLFVPARKGHGNEASLTQEQLRGAQDFDVYIPKSTLASLSWPLTVQCPGCQKTFLANHSGIYSPQFFQHCVKECELYKKLDLISHCFSCKTSFSNNQSYRRHECVNSRTKKQRLKPILIDTNCRQVNKLTQQQLIEARSYNFYISKTAHANRSWSRTVQCPGCQQLFPARKVGTYSPQFYKHCVKECEEYKKLNLIAHCIPCKLSFYHLNGYAHHDCVESTKTKYDQPQTVLTTDGSEMKIHFPDYAKRTFYDSMQESCQGCGRQFRRYRKIWEPDYYVHCINECDSYKKLGNLRFFTLPEYQFRFLDLIKKCNGCRLVFTNYYALNWHQVNFHRKRLALETGDENISKTK